MATTNDERFSAVLLDEHEGKWGVIDATLVGSASNPSGVVAVHPNEVLAETDAELRGEGLIDEPQPMAVPALWWRDSIVQGRATQLARVIAGADVGMTRLAKTEVEALRLLAVQTLFALRGDTDAAREPLTSALVNLNFAVAAAKDRLN